jgi:hypothetical protein
MGRGGASGSGMTNPNPTAGTDQKNCGLETFMLERLPPDLLLVLDRSSSMNRKAMGSNNNLWMDAVAALDVTIMTTQDKVNWGLKMFPVPNGCNVPTGVEVPIGGMAHSSMLMSMNSMGYNMTGDGGTPTGDAIKAGVAYLKTVMTKNPKYIVLTTDGEPTCPRSGAEPYALDAIRAAVADGYKVFVVGVAIGSTGHNVLNMMATLGGAPRMDPMYKYYPVANKDDLVKTLDQITTVASNCIFPLGKRPPNPDDVAVKISGVKVDRSDQNGWSYGPNMMSIQLNGMACETVKMGNANNVQIIFGCPGVYIP